MMKYIDQIEMKGKKVFLRVDFNVPMDKEGNVTGDKRVRASIPTINYALEKGAKLIIASHLGRPKGKRVDGNVAQTGGESSVGTAAKRSYVFR